nr:hypothetical protein HK105_000223 [Polyrhizophydium stewartii]
MSALNTPIWNISDPLLPKTRGVGFIPGAKQQNVTHVNFAVLSVFDVLGIAFAGFQKPCVYWFGEDYPTSPVYERPSNSSGVLVRDTTFTAEPLGGWLASLITGVPSGIIDNFAVQKFASLQQRTWAVYGSDPSVADSLIGSRPKPLPLTPTKFVELLDPTRQPPAFPRANQTSGLFDTLITRYFYDVDGLSDKTRALNNVMPVPYFNRTAGLGSNAIDDAISKAIKGVLIDIAKLDKSILFPGNPGQRDPAKLADFYIKIGKILFSLPHGGIYVNRVDHASRNYSWNLHYGNDDRLTGASNFPDPGMRALLQMTQLHNAVLRTSNPTYLGDATITQGLRIMPEVADSSVSIDLSSSFGGVLYPFGVSFLLPIFVIMLVSDKERRILMMTQMNGLKPWAYYLSQYVTFLILFCVSTGFFLAAGFIAHLPFFTLTDPSVYLALFALWVHTGVLISLAMGLLYPTNSFPTGYFVWPPFAFYRGLRNINRASYKWYLTPYRWSDLVPGDEVFTAMMFLVVEIPIYLGVAAYLTAVLPSEFGVRLPWHFPVTEPLKAIRRSSRRRRQGLAFMNSEAEMAIEIDLNEHETRFEDADVKAERARVDNGEFDAGSPLVVRHMRKVYAGRGGAGPKLAVKDVTFAVEEGIVFGLLGPNGAGKTTLISILTGLYEASTGTGTLAGFDVTTDTAEVYKRIGICPQFDILWDELTVSEHLYFYARLKGISPSEEREAVRIAMSNVALTGYENRVSRSLSGGEKRRLSIAIALLGSPKVVFLDEPTTGLDPEVRRLIWNIVNNSKQGKTIVLTTHSMEEAEALCQRIGIMAKGTLRCLANPIRLKQVYGTGFRIYFNSLEDDTPRASAFVESLLPAGWKKVDAFATNVSYEFPAVAGSLSMLFKQIEQHKVENGILDWGVGQTTLEDVFISLISESDADTD